MDNILYSGFARFALLLHASCYLWMQTESGVWVDRDARDVEAAPKVRSRCADSGCGAVPLFINFASFCVEKLQFRGFLTLK